MLKCQFAEIQNNYHNVSFIGDQKEFIHNNVQRPTNLRHKSPSVNLHLYPVSESIENRFSVVYQLIVFNVCQMSEKIATGMNGLTVVTFVV